MKKLFIGILFSILFLGKSVCAETLTSNGITYTRWQTAYATYLTIPILNGYDAGTDTAIYNDAGESANNSGAVNVAEINDNISFQVYIPTLGSTGINVFIEGRFGTETQWADIYTKSFTATTAKSYTIPLDTEKPKYIRAGAQATGTDGVDSISIHALCKEKRSR